MRLCAATAQLVYACDWSRSRFAQHGLQHSPNSLGEDALASGVWMDAIAQIQVGIASDADGERPA